MIASLARVELLLLLRNRSAALLALVVPLVMGVFVATSVGSGEREWTAALTLQLVFALGFTVYLTVTTSLTARRQDLYLKRLRTGAAPDLVVLVGVVLPAVLLGLAQCALLLGVAFALDAPFPPRPDLLVLGVVAAALGCAAVGVATSGFTASAELAQVTTLPYTAAMLGGGLWALSRPDAKPLVLPGGALADLVRAAWGGSTDHALLAVGSLLAWAAVGAWVAGRHFRWDRRA
ncbi:ABC transporter permease [Actinosynnema sp. NPDC020468]|uniref:ABC transporter permease n=1 Tax=Actinosynnema sp. NPDC020468 TaxID=3154488 RepID=UPI00340E2BA9